LIGTTVEIECSKKVPALLSHNKNYFLKLSGTIPKEKELEFEQTYRFVATQMPKTCVDYSIAKDVLHDGFYYFVSYWPSLEAMDTFSHSSIFSMLLGAFNVLGQLSEHVYGE